MTTNITTSCGGHDDHVYKIWILCQFPFLSYKRWRDRQTNRLQCSLLWGGPRNKISFMTFSCVSPFSGFLLTVVCLSNVPGTTKVKIQLGALYVGVTYRNVVMLEPIIQLTKMGWKSNGNVCIIACIWTETIQAIPVGACSGTETSIQWTRSSVVAERPHVLHVIQYEHLYSPDNW